jgi:hypothetical protein
MTQRPVKVLPGSSTTCADEISPITEPFAVTNTSLFAFMFPSTLPRTKTLSAMISAKTAASLSITRSLVASISPVTVPFIIKGLENLIVPENVISFASMVSKSSSSNSKNWESLPSSIVLMYSLKLSSSIPKKYLSVLYDSVIL